VEELATRMDLVEMFVPEVSPAEIVVRSALVYLLVLVLFRLFGRLQQARHAGFDLAVMFLLGTALRKTIVGDDPSLTSGAIGLTTLFALDWVMSFFTWRSERLSLIVEGRPRQIVKDGAPIEESLARSRLNIHELRERLREQGTDELEKVRAAFVERDGKITFLLRG
jgi:uncharacterized membrane protein YcaP (DUF421 family)